MFGASLAGFGGPRGVLEGFSKESEGSAFDANIVRRLLVFIRPHWNRMAIAFVLMLVATGLTLLAPYLVKVAIDQHIAQGNVTG